MKMFIFIIISMILIIFNIFSIAWLTTIDKNAPRITFNAFKKIYVLSPSKWNFNLESVTYKRNEGWIRVEFKHYIDVLKYNYFKNKIEKDKSYLQKMQNEKELIASIQKDIESYRQENISELKRALNLESK